MKSGSSSIQVLGSILILGVIICIHNYDFIGEREKRVEKEFPYLETLSYDTTFQGNIYRIKHGPLNGTSSVTLNTGYKFSVTSDNTYANKQTKVDFINFIREGDYFHKLAHSDTIYIYKAPHNTKYVFKYGVTRK